MSQTTFTTQSNITGGFLNKDIPYNAQVCVYNSSNDKIYSLDGTSVVVYRKLNELFIYEDSVLINSLLGATETISGPRAISTDGNYIYVYTATFDSSQPSSSDQSVSVIRISLDLSTGDITNLHTESGADTLDRADFNDDDGVGISIDGSTMYVTYSEQQAGGAYENQIREYTIAGTVYTLANTYVGGFINDDNSWIYYSSIDDTVYYNNEVNFSQIRSFDLATTTQSTANYNVYLGQYLQPNLQLDKGEIVSVVSDTIDTFTLLIKYPYTHSPSVPSTSTSKFTTYMLREITVPKV